MGLQLTQLTQPPVFGKHHPTMQICIPQSMYPSPNAVRFLICSLSLATASVDYSYKHRVIIPEPGTEVCWERSGQMYSGKVLRRGPRSTSTVVVQHVGDQGKTSVQVRDLHSACHKVGDTAPLYTGGKLDESPIVVKVTPSILTDGMRFRYTLANNKSLVPVTTETADTFISGETMLYVLDGHSLKQGKPIWNRVTYISKAKAAHFFHGHTSIAIQDLDRDGSKSSRNSWYNSRQVYQLFDTPPLPPGWVWDVTKKGKTYYYQTEKEPETGHSLLGKVSITFTRPVRRRRRLDALIERFQRESNRIHYGD